MSDIRIIKAEKIHLAKIKALADSMLLSTKPESENAEQEGFLVSGYSLADYENFLESAEHFYVASAEENILGFVLAYTSESIKGSETVNTLLKSHLIDPFILIKQVCVDSSYKGSGIGSALYKWLFDMAPEQGFAAAIVTEPLNERSVNYHEKNGFKHLCDIVPPADPDGKTRLRGIWFRNTREKRDQLPETRLYTPNKDEELGHQLTKLEANISLYTHEDNLNWTKLGMLVTFMMAAFAAFAYVLEKPAGLETSIMALSTIIFGFAINWIFYEKIKSGLMYMNSHKERVKACERRILRLNPNLTASVSITNNKISGQSSTVSLMHKIPIISFFLWILFSAVLMAKVIQSI